MCRNIHTLFNYEPPATEHEVEDAALQYVRKISGFTKPSRANEEVFARAVEEVAGATQRLIDGLVTSASRRLARSRPLAHASARRSASRREPRQAVRTAGAERGPVPGGQRADRDARRERAGLVTRRNGRVPLRVRRRGRLRTARPRATRRLRTRPLAGRPLRRAPGPRDARDRACRRVERRLRRRRQDPGGRTVRRGRPARRTLVLT